jgi:hypothetical protein
MDMSSPVDTRSRPRYGILGLLFVLTFLAGLALAAYGGRRLGWFAGERTVAGASVVQPSGRAPAPIPVVAPPPPADLATLTAREAGLSAQLSALEARAARLTADAAAAGAQAGRAESLLIAAAARRALDRGRPLGRIEDQLRLRFGTVQPRAVDIVAETARQPVTLEDLRLAFDAIAPDLQTGARSGALSAIGRELGQLVVLRHAGSPSPLPAERLARARRLLDGGEVEAALAEARALPGAGRAGAWFDAAVRYVQARRALDLLEDAAIATPVAAPAVQGVQGR